MRFPTEIQDDLSKKAMRHGKRWLADAIEGTPFPGLSYSLKPTYGEAQLDVDGFRDFLKAWEEKKKDFQVTYEEVSWPRLGGKLQVPSSIVFASPEEALKFIQGKSRNLEEEWTQKLERLRILSEKFGREATKNFAQEGKAIADTEANFKRLIDANSWLLENQKARCFLREIPVVGVDTKWMEKNRKYICWCLSSALGRDLTWSDVLKEWEIKRAPTLIRARHLQDLIAEMEPSESAALPASVLNRLTPRRVLIIENLQTGLSVTADKEVLILMGLGFDLQPLKEIAWLKETEVFYMGDLDYHGLKILSYLRSILPKTKSLLTNLSSFEKWKDLAVTDPTENSGSFSSIGLTDEEAKLLVFLQEKKLRLEQERIPISELEKELEKAGLKTPETAP